MGSSIATTDRTRTRRSGLAVVVAGIAIVVGALGSAAVDGLWVAILVGFLGMVYGIPGIHDHQAPADGLPGRWGSVLIRYGGALMVLLGVAFLVWEAVGDPPEAGPAVVDVAWMVGFAAFVVGVVLFSIGIIRAKVLPAASGILMLVGIVAAIVIDMATGAFFEDEGTTTEWGFLIGVPLFGLGLVWAGYTVVKRADARSSV